MLYIIYQNTKYAIEIKKIQIRLKRLIRAVFTLLVTAVLLIICVNFCRFPEKYSTIWRYQLYNEIKSGNQEAINYYNRVYTANGIDLFEE